MDDRLLPDKALQFDNTFSNAAATAPRRRPAEPPLPPPPAPAPAWRCTMGIHETAAMAWLTPPRADSPSSMTGPWQWCVDVRWTRQRVMWKRAGRTGRPPWTLLLLLHQKPDLSYSNKNRAGHGYVFTKNGYFCSICGQKIFGTNKICLSGYT